MCDCRALIVVFTHLWSPKRADLHVARGNAKTCEEAADSQVSGSALLTRRERDSGGRSGAKGVEERSSVATIRDVVAPGIKPLPPVPENATPRSSQRETRGNATLAQGSPRLPHLDF